MLYIFLHVQEILMLQKVEATTAFCNIKFVVCRGGNVVMCAEMNLNLHCNVVAQQVALKYCPYYLPNNL